MKTNRTRWLILLGLIAAVVIFAAFALRGKDKAEYFTAKVERGDIRAVVEATGTINAVITVQVGSQVSGTILQLLVDFNSRVKKGDLIARIDPRLYQGAFLQAQADLANADANLAASKANLEKAKASALQSKADYERTAGLTKEGVMSQQNFDLAKATADSADAQVTAAEAQVKQAAAQVQQKKAALDVTQTNLNYTYIYAPVDGIVINRAVDIGQTVAASLQAPTLFTIAQDLTKMQVYAQTDESDVGQIKVGQRVSFKVDAYPKDVFTGAVSQIRMNATVVQNVVTYNTIIDFANPDMKLFPGMTAYVTIPVASAQNVVKVPNGALRYKPDMKPEEIRALYDKYGLHLGGKPGDKKDTTESAAAPKPAPAGGEQPGGSVAKVRESRQDRAILWKLRADQTLEPVQLQLGITDHTVTEVTQVLQGQINEGDVVVVGNATKSTKSGPPGMGGSRPPGR